MCARAVCKECHWSGVMLGSLEASKRLGITGYCCRAATCCRCKASKYQPGFTALQGKKKEKEPSLGMVRVLGARTLSYKSNLCTLSHPLSPSMTNSNAEMLDSPLVLIPAIGPQIHSKKEWDCIKACKVFSQLWLISSL